MNEDYVAKLEKAGNIGVALGAVSNGLVTIDIDNDSHVEAFLEANPLLRHTLRTTAQRGCNIWLRCTTDYPSSRNLSDQSGNPICGASRTIQDASPWYRAKPAKTSLSGSVNRRISPTSERIGIPRKRHFFSKKQYAAPKASDMSKTTAVITTKLIRASLPPIAECSVKSPSNAAEMA
jgi:Bifunctional DNA primase/polymerase, N-terminal.